MRVVLDTNVFISAMLIQASRPAELIARWREGKFSVLTAAPQLEELTRVTRYPKIRARLSPSLAGRLINEMRDLAIMVNRLPLVDASPNPYDNYLFSIASGGFADYLVMGDKRDLLALAKHDRTAILSVSDFLDRIDRK